MCVVGVWNCAGIIICIEREDAEGIAAAAKKADSLVDGLSGFSASNAETLVMLLLFTVEDWRWKMFRMVIKVRGEKVQKRGVGRGSTY